jgi:hypothetical protein
MVSYIFDKYINIQYIYVIVVLRPNLPPRTIDISINLLFIYGCFAASGIEQKNGTGIAIKVRGCINIFLLYILRYLR